jgi:hypothetical protein
LGFKFFFCIVFGVWNLGFEFIGFGVLGLDLMIWVLGLSLRFAVLDFLVLDLGWGL